MWFIIIIRCLPPQFLKRKPLICTSYSILWLHSDITANNNNGCVRRPSRRSSSSYEPRRIASPYGRVQLIHTTPFSVWTLINCWQRTAYITPDCPSTRYARCPRPYYSNRRRDIVLLRNTTKRRRSRRNHPELKVVTRTIPRTKN